MRKHRYAGLGTDDLLGGWVDDGDAGLADRLSPVAVDEELTGSRVKQQIYGRKRRATRDRDRSQHHLLVRRRVAARPGQDHHQRPGQQDSVYVAFTDSERIIGDVAKNQVAMNPINTVFGTTLLAITNGEDAGACDEDAYRSNRKASGRR
ncbi:hypothetical protein RJ640_022385 [Escallonia rubra]|uniref:Uncharacterized protein n=1 Tax=Escallonia rubra TaxID=112253 RepID=A0AA88U0G5_9ASTE|nr:hypothetical protein RJ640_022385 [Escallonia rubra]